MKKNNPLVYASSNKSRHKGVIKAYKKQMRLLINPLLGSTVIISDIKKDGIIRE
ncbi:MAG: hypothetical protein WBL64_08765 [Nitrososphaeraceae archaeon]|jgi:hypothetical protein